MSGLGATESGPSALFCTKEMMRSSGAIGLPVPGIEMKLAPVDGKLEARLKGPSITQGYWRQPDTTAASFDEEGYYKLGDAVRFADPDEPLKGFFFDGRISEDFKLSTGTWVRVGMLRASLLSVFGGYAKDVVIAGHEQDDIAILIFPDFEALRALTGDLAAPVRKRSCRTGQRAAYSARSSRRQPPPAPDRRTASPAPSCSKSRHPSTATRSPTRVPSISGPCSRAARRLSRSCIAARLPPRHRYKLEGARRGLATSVSRRRIGTDLSPVGVMNRAFPSPRPSPHGRGDAVATRAGASLSHGERAGVRGATPVRRDLRGSGAAARISGHFNWSGGFSHSLPEKGE